MNPGILGFKCSHCGIMFQKENGGICSVCKKSFCLTHLYCDKEECYCLEHKPAGLKRKLYEKFLHGDIFSLSDLLGKHKKKGD